MESLVIEILVLAIMFGVSLSLFWFMRKVQNTVLKIVLGILSGCVAVIFLLMFSIAAFFAYEEPPSISKLATHFEERRSTLEQILAMSEEDKYFFRVDPTFLDYDFTHGKWDGKAVVGEDAAKIPPARWQVYRTLFAKAKLDQGFVRRPDGDVYFMAGSVGILNNGHTTGYLYCREPGSAASQDFDEPCKSATKNSGYQDYSNDPRRDAYSFKKVADHWFVYDQGPS
jgi:hypothetical protein